MQIELPDNLVSQASAAGFSSVEQYVKHLIAKDAADQASQEKSEEDSLAPMPPEEWTRRLRDMTDAAKPYNPNVDDRRESIYAVR